MRYLSWEKTESVEGNKNAFEANQNLNANGKIAPLRDTFYLSLSGEVIRQVFRRCITDIIE